MVNRSERRQMEREQGSGAIKGWISHPAPKQLKKGGGWFGQMDRVFRSYDNAFLVMIRDVETEWGTVQHACMRNLESTDIPWRDKQRIKNELFGSERVAVEVFPKTSELVDDANMYHIWVLPADMNLPFGIERKGRV